MNTHRSESNAYWRPWVEAAGVGITLFACASLSIWVTRDANGISLFWPGNAAAACAFIRLKRVHWVAALSIVFVAALSANVIAADRLWIDAAPFAVVHTLEVALMVVTFRQFIVLPYPTLNVGQAALMTVILGIAIPGMVALAAALLLKAKLGTSFAECALPWWSSHTLGACLLGPPVILFSSSETVRLTRLRYLPANLLTLVGSLFACYVAIRYIRFPFAIVGLILLAAAFRLGGFGTAVLSLGMGFLIANLWLVGVRPLGLDPEAMASVSLSGLPIISLLAALMPPIAVGIGSDARRAAARALLGSERRFRESMQFSPIGAVIADVDGLWRYTNIALQQMLGYTEHELRALPPGGLYAPEDWKDAQSRFQALIRGETQSYSAIRHFRHRTGRMIVAQVAVSLLKDEGGSPLHFVIQIQSLEERRRAEEKAAEERERLESTLATISDAVVTTDAQTQITFINPAAQMLLGLDLTSARGRRLDQVLHLTDVLTSKAATNLLAQTLLHATVSRREQPCLLHRPDGVLCYVTDHVSPVINGAGVVTGTVAVFRDSSADVGRTEGLRHQALHDQLTGLSNRADFECRVAQTFQSSRHLNRPAVIIAIDLDRFKALNDTAGHAAGDAMLRMVADACRHAVRHSDTVARLGGDEFAVVLPDCPEEYAARIGKNLLASINGLELEWKGERYSIGASIGLAKDCPTFATESEWLQAADAACYRAKRQGRGQLRWSHVDSDNVVAIFQSRL